MIKPFIKRIGVSLFRTLRNWDREQRKREISANWNLPESVDLHHSVDLCGHIEIGPHSYANEGTRIASGSNSKVIIGKYCEIGRYVHIMAYTHDLDQPTNCESATRLIKESDITIGDYVWIGDKVFIREGVTIADHAVVAANSVVTKSVSPYEIVGGVPAKHLKFNYHASGNHAPESKSSG